MIIICKSELYKGYYYVGTLLNYHYGSKVFNSFTHCKRLDTVIKTVKNYNLCSKTNCKMYLYNGIIKQ